MITKLATNLSFYSALLGFSGLLVSTLYGWYLSHKEKSVTKEESKKVANTLPAEKEHAKLEATQIINKAKKKKNEYISKVSNYVFVILILSFGVSIGGMIVSVEEDSKLEERVAIIEDYLWPSSGPDGGGGGAPTLSDQISSINDSVSRMEGLQLKIIETIDETEPHSQALTQQVISLQIEISNLKNQIEILKRQQGGGEGGVTLEVEQ